MELSSYTLPELIDLQKQLPAEIERRKQGERKTLVDELRKLAIEKGFSLDELLGGKPVVKKGQVGVASIVTLLILHKPGQAVAVSRCG